jgi:hypothetical protein
MFPSRNFHKLTSTTPVGDNHNQIENILIDRRCGADCDVDHYMVVAKVRVRLGVSKQTAHMFHVKGFTLKKLNEAESNDQYQVEISNRIAALEDFDAEVNINRERETNSGNIKFTAKESLGHYALKKRNPWFDE